MLQTFKPVIVGSYASLKGGFYPSWRERNYGDIDLVVAEDQYQFVVRHYKNRGILKGLEETYDIEFSNIKSKLLNKLCLEEMFVPELGVHCKLAPLEVIWATLVYCAGYAPNSHEKSLRDLIFYESMLDREKITKLHLDLAELYRLSSLESVKNRFERKLHE